MAFVKGFYCRGCGSTCGSTNSGGDKQGVHCFVCGAGDWEPTFRDLRGLSFEEAIWVISREPGRNWQIIPRIATDRSFSSVVTSKSALRAAGLHYCVDTEYLERGNNGLSGNQNVPSPEGDSK